MQAQQQLETKMDEYFVRKAPFQIPKNGREALVKHLPLISLVVGFLSLLAVAGLWRLAHKAQKLSDSINTIAQTYGIDTGVKSVNYGVVFYTAFAVLIVQTILIIAAYPGLKANSKKRGWDFLLYSALISFVYNFVYAFSAPGSLFDIFTGMLGLVISLYILAQIKSYYVTKPTKVTAKK